MGLRTNHGALRVDHRFSFRAENVGVPREHLGIGGNPTDSLFEMGELGL